MKLQTDKVPSAESYLLNLYRRNNPGRIVELGADPQMRLIARTAHGIPRISVVDFAAENAYKRGWWNFIKNIGINLERVDCDAQNLSTVIRTADVIYAHAVLFSADGGEDLRRNIKHRRGELILSESELRRLYDGFLNAESKTIIGACEIAKMGHVIWFSYNGNHTLFERLVTEQRRTLVKSQVTMMCGECSEDLLWVYHLKPCSS